MTVRTFSQRSVEELAAAASIPVINALTNEHHPCQALADAMTLEEEFGTFAGIGSRSSATATTSPSLIEAAGLAGCVAGGDAAGMRTSPPIVEGARRRCERAVARSS